MTFTAQFRCGVDESGRVSAPYFGGGRYLFAEPDNRNSLPIGLAVSSPTNVSVSQPILTGGEGVAGTVGGD